MNMNTNATVKHDKGIKQPGAKGNGFTLIEILVSLLLISVAVLLLSKVIVCAIDGHMKSQIRFNMGQELESCKNRLLSKSFASVDLEDGNYSKKENHLDVNWNIKSITPTLKMIQLTVAYNKYRYKRLTKRAYFYKSKYIKNNETAR